MSNDTRLDREKNNVNNSVNNCVPIKSIQTLFHFSVLKVEFTDPALGNLFN